MKDPNKKLKITEWAEEDRPREKLLTKGVSALSNAELIAILIGSGNKKETAVELSQRILHYTENNLNNLAKRSVNDLIKNFFGIGEAKAISIIAALELGKRRRLTETLQQNQILSSIDIYNIFQPILGDIKHEESWALFLNNSNKLIKKIQLSKGGLTGTIIDIRILIREALECSATNIVLIHNHPSGNTKPSKEDDKITNKVKEACNLLDIYLLDHLIISDYKYFSYRDNNLL